MRAFLADLLAARLPVYVIVRREQGGVHVYVAGYCVAVVAVDLDG